MTPELLSLQIVCIIILYAVTKIENMDMNPFHRGLTTVPIGMYAGYGFIKIFEIFHGNAGFSILSTWQTIVYLFSMLAALFVMFSSVLIIYRLIRPPAK